MLTSLKRRAHESASRRFPNYFMRSGAFQRFTLLTLSILRLAPNALAQKNFEFWNWIREMRQDPRVPNVKRKSKVRRIIK